MSEGTDQSFLKERLPRLVMIAALVLWCAHTFLKVGQAFDEGEHAHAAWLMSQGLQPVDDFFEHHPPLLWDVLRIGFGLGFHGASVLIWGRLLVLICGIATFLGLRTLGRQWASAPDRRAFPGLAGLLCFWVMTLELPTLFVVRPETLSLPLVVLAFVAWMRSLREPGGLGWAALAGVLFSMGVYASPRLVLMLPLVLVFNGNRQLSVADLLRRVALGAVGFLAFFSAFTVLSGYSLKKFLFDLEFSAHLQAVGQYPDTSLLWQWLWVYGSIAAAAAILLWTSGAPDRRRGAAALAYGGVLFVVSDFTAHSFRYPQQYVTTLLAFCLALTWIDAKQAAPLERRQWRGALAAAAVALPALVAIVHVEPWGFFDTLNARETFGSFVPAGESVQVFPSHSPIAVKDASYYFFDLMEGEDRLCRAVNSWKGEPALPHCDRTKELLEKKPALVETSWLMLAPADQKKAVESLFDAEYLAVKNVSEEQVMQGVRIRKSIAAALQGN